MQPTNVDDTARAAEASIEQVEADLKRLGTFSQEVRHTLDEADRAKLDVQHALAAFRNSDHCFPTFLRSAVSCSQ